MLLRIDLGNKQHTAVWQQPGHSGSFYFLGLGQYSRLNLRAEKLVALVFKKNHQSYNTQLTSKWHKLSETKTTIS